MATVRAPLLCLASAGKLGSHLVTAKRQGKNIVRQNVLARDAQTPAQLAHRTTFAQVISFWRTQFDASAGDAAWARVAALSPTPLSAYNAFTRSAIAAAAEQPVSAYVWKFWCVPSQRVAFQTKIVTNPAETKETGFFQIWRGESIGQMSIFKADATIGTSFVISTDLGDPGQKLYLQIRRGDSIRSGLGYVTLL